MKPVDAAVDIDAILDDGAVGLRYFEVFLPRYRDWTGTVPVSGDHAALTAGYHRERGMDPGPLRAFATALGGELERCLEHEARVLADRAGNLPTYWNGSAAAANAHGFLAYTAHRVETGLDTLRSIHTTVSAGATRLVDAVRVKADTVRRDYDPGTAAGRTPQQIDRIIDCARHRAEAEESLVAELRTALSGNTFACDVDTSTVCALWLDTVFVPEIDTAAATFADLCETTDTTVIGIYDEIIEALDRLPIPAFISPGGRPAADTDLTHTGGRPGYPMPPVLRAATAIPEPDATAPRTPPGMADTTASVPPVGHPRETVSGLPAVAPPTAIGCCVPATPPISETAVRPVDSTNRSIPDDPGSSSSEAVEASEGTGIPGRWAPDDIAAVVTAIGAITGSIPDLITATGSLVDNLDEIVTAAGNAVATVIDAVDGQSAVSPESQVVDPAIAPPPSEGTGDSADEPRPPEEALPEEGCATPGGGTSTDGVPGATENTKPDGRDTPADRGTTDIDTLDPPAAVPHHEEPWYGPEPTLAPPSPPLDQETDTAAMAVFSPNLPLPQGRKK
ncbi:hypothetical protein [Nocardia paucivorans]|uniref:hypothetical protein n=1 Tax=Nocardia paucivorans TaxID=114259 RepID=UPI0002EB24F3|nr:hypothetical protein [Nocardia paucivorans]